jgi:hypothetical protein
MATEHEVRRSDGLEKELRMLYYYGAGAKQIRRLWNRSQSRAGAGAKAIRWLGGAKVVMTTEQELKRSDGLQEQLKRLDGYGA